MLRRLCFLDAAVAQMNKAFKGEMGVFNLLQHFGDQYGVVRHRKAQVLDIDFKCQKSAKSTHPVFRIQLVVTDDRKRIVGLGSVRASEAFGVECWASKRSAVSASV